ASGTCRYSLECRPLVYSKWPSRRAPVSRSTDTTSSWVGINCMSNPFSVGAAPRQYARNRAHQDLPIERQRPIINVLHIHLHPGLEIDVVAPRHRPEAGQPRPHAQPPPLPALILLDLARHCRPRPHHRHIPAQHIPQLRPLIDRKLAQIAPDRRQPWIVRNLERRLPRAEVGHRLLEFLGVLAHRAKFIKHDPPPLQPTPHRPENGATRRGQTD